jgi:hypothetical protein
MGHKKFLSIVSGLLFHGFKILSSTSTALQHGFGFMFATGTRAGFGNKYLTSNQGTTSNIAGVSTFQEEFQ